MRNKEKIDSWISRSRARSLLSLYDGMGEVIIDFEGMSTIGQGFADEMFRVHRNSYPEMKLTPINMNGAVKDMIIHVLLSAKA